MILNCGGTLAWPDSYRQSYPFRNIELDGALERYLLLSEAPDWGDRRRFYENGLFS
jgi:hypothetical protein